MRHTLPLIFSAVALVAAAPTGIQPAHLDTGVSPHQDFFRHANGTWLKETKIPADLSSWGAFNELREGNRTILRQIMDEAVAKPASPLAAKVGTFYAAGMDTAAIEKAGLKPLQGRLDSLKAVKDAASLATVAAKLNRESVGALFGAFVAQDDKDSTRYILQLTQGGLGLPDRDYYLLTDAKSVELRKAYEAHLGAMLQLLGETPEAAKAGAAQVLALETKLATASMSLTDQRDPNAIYHKMTPADLARQAPGFPWEAYLHTLGVKPQKQLLVRQPGFFKALGQMAGSVPAAQWQTYLKVRLVEAFADQLPEAFVKQSFAFHGKVLNGLPEAEARWKKVQSQTDGALGEIVGQLYVAKAFAPEAKVKMKAMIEDLRAALGDRIRQLDWMTEPTKKAALEKLAAFNVKVGYPDKWIDYTKLKVTPGQYLENVAASRVFDLERNFDRLGRPIDRAEWGMTPQTVNAYYDPSMNEIVFPAGILQAPFFDLKADDAVNYGAIGMVIGHEMTHGFDDQGRQYDAKGNLRDWWTEADAKAYNTRTALVEAQYNAFEALPGLKVNGKLTLGENIADLGGLKIAFEALKKQWARTGKPAPKDGFTPEQRFFLGYAQSWRFTARDEAVRNRVMTDPHSPAVFRVNGPLSNMPEFFEAFSVPAGAPMRRADKDRPTIW